MSISDLIDKVSPIIDKIKPLADKFIHDDGERGLFVNETSAILQESLVQARIDLKDADSPIWWDRDWRPAIGWICCAGLILHFMIIPLIMFIETLFGKVPLSIPFDLSQLSNLIYGLLGMGTLIVAKEIHQAHIASKQNDSTSS